MSSWAGTARRPTDDTSSDTHNNYGWFLCQHKREKESIPHFMAAIKNPLYATPGVAFVNAGVCARKAGDNKEAEDFLHRALQLQPDNTQAMYALSDLKFSTGDYFAARKYFTGFSQNADQLTAEQLWLGFRISRKVGDRNAEASYGVQLRNRFPDSREAQMLTQMVKDGTAR